eukprot:1177993-Prorocentrum_minimum.AAC.3
MHLALSDAEFARRTLFADIRLAAARGAPRARGARARPARQRLGGGDALARPHPREPPGRLLRRARRLLSPRPGRAGCVRVHARVLTSCGHDPIGAESGGRGGRRVYRGGGAELGSLQNGLGQVRGGLEPFDGDPVAVFGGGDDGDGRAGHLGGGVTAVRSRRGDDGDGDGGDRLGGAADGDSVDSDSANG